jgi:hypothetical protein
MLYFISWRSATGPRQSRRPSCEAGATRDRDETSSCLDVKKPRRYPLGLCFLGNSSSLHDPATQVQDRRDAQQTDATRFSHRGQRA